MYNKYNFTFSVGINADECDSVTRDIIIDSVKQDIIDVLQKHDIIFGDLIYSRVINCVEDKSKVDIGVDSV